MWTSVVIPLLVAGLPAFAGWWASRENRRQAEASALRSEREATAARESVAELERLRRLEERVREAKVGAYKPIITELGKLWGKDDSKTPPQQAKLQTGVRDAMNNFWPLAIIYASDEAQRAFGRMMQAFFSSAPHAISFRLYSEWLIEARRDLADEGTKLSPTDIWAPKISDLFQGESVITGFDNLPFHDLAEREQWTVPWLGTSLEHPRIAINTTSH